MVHWGGDESSAGFNQQWRRRTVFILHRAVGPDENRRDGRIVDVAVGEERSGPRHCRYTRGTIGHLDLGHLPCTDAAIGGRMIARSRSHQPLRDW